MKGSAAVGTATTPSLAELDALPVAGAADALAPLFEGAQRFLARLVAERPFESWADLFDVARGIAQAMPEDEQIELVNAHPRLGAAPATVSALSHAEQGYARPRAADDATTLATLERLNDAYEARYGFRYCVFVAGRSRTALIAELEATLRDRPDRASELRRALDAVVDIARARAGCSDDAS